MSPGLGLRSRPVHPAADYHRKVTPDTDRMLRSCALFSRLSPEDRSKVAAVSVARDYEKGDRVFSDQEVAEMRAQVAVLQAQIEERMAPHDASAEKLLNKDQRNKLQALRKNGWKPCSEPCAAPGTASSCAGKEGGKGAACCAGAAGTGAKAAPVKPAPPAPNATVE